jgi:hypothetical protein
VAVIGDSANCASIRLHKSLGFREVGVLRAVGFKFDRWIDSVLMQRDLGAGDSGVVGRALDIRLGSKLSDAMTTARFPSRPAEIFDGRNRRGSLRRLTRVGTVTIEPP